MPLDVVGGLVWGKSRWCAGGLGEVKECLGGLEEAGRAFNDCRLEKEVDTGCCCWIEADWLGEF